MSIAAAALICLVVAVTDGDTLKVRCGDPGGYEQVTIRLAEIDAPEKSQAFGQRSKGALSDLCFAALATVRPVNRDRYGRVIARIECNGRDANTEQVRNGMAWAYVKYQTDARFALLEKQARLSRLGLWHDPE